MSRYRDLSTKHQKEVNDFPIGFGFGPDGLDKILKTLKVESAEDLVGIGAGGAIRKTDIPKWKDLQQRQQDERDQAFNDDTYIFDMFYDTLADHEYCVTGDDYECIEYSDVTAEDIGSDPRLGKLYNSAKEKYMASVVY